MNFNFFFIITVEAEQYDIGIKLGEKYLDFQVLVEIADRTNDEGRLREYNEKFKEYVCIF